MLMTDLDSNNVSRCDRLRLIFRSLILVLLCVAILVYMPAFAFLVTIPVGLLALILRFITSVCIARATAYILLFSAFVLFVTNILRVSRKQPYIPYASIILFMSGINTCISSGMTPFNEIVRSDSLFETLLLYSVLLIEFVSYSIAKQILISSYVIFTQIFKLFHSTRRRC